MKLSERIKDRNRKPTLGGDYWLFWQDDMDELEQLETELREANQRCSQENVANRYHMKELEKIKGERDALRMFIYHSGTIAPCRCCMDTLGYNPTDDPEGGD